MNPIRSSLPSSSWLVATVVPWLTAVTALAVEVHQAQDLADAVEEALGGVGGGGRRLRGRGLAGLLVHGDDVGERPAGVDADADPALTHGRNLSGEISLGGRLGGGPVTICGGAGPASDQSRPKSSENGGVDALAARVGSRGTECVMSTPASRSSGDRRSAGWRSVGAAARRAADGAKVVTGSSPGVVPKSASCAAIDVMRRGGRTSTRILARSATGMAWATRKCDRSRHFGGGSQIR